MSRQTTKTTASPRTNSSSSPSTSTATAPARRPSNEQIRKRAYELYLARRGVGGTPEQDWLQAERELSRETNGR